MWGIYNEKQPDAKSADESFSSDSAMKTFLFSSGS